LKNRATITGTRFSRQYARASHSSSALEQAYAQREWTVAPRVRSSPSSNGTLAPLPYTSEVEATTTGFCFLAAAWSTASVALTLVSMVCTGFSTMSRTPTAAARCTVTSHRSTSSLTRGRSVAEPIRYSKPGRPIRVSMFSMLPVERSSSTST